MKKIATSFLIVLSIATFLPVRSSEALTSNCMKSLHRQALSDAINLVPDELKAILKDNEANIRRQVDTIHGTAPRDRQTFQANYKTITDELKTSDKKRLDYLSRVMTDITIYPFLKYSPIKMYESCDEAKVLSSASVIYDGFNATTASIEFAENSYKYEGKSDLLKLQKFYSIIVNDISDLWVSMWKDAGKSLSGLPEINMVLREGSVVGQVANTKNQPLRDLKPDDGTPIIISNDDLSKYKNPSDNSSRGSWAGCINASDCPPGLSCVIFPLFRVGVCKTPQEARQLQDQSDANRLNNSLNNIDNKLDRIERRSRWGY